MTAIKATLTGDWGGADFKQSDNLARDLNKGPTCVLSMEGMSMYTLSSEHRVEGKAEKGLEAGKASRPYLGHRSACRALSSSKQHNQN